MSFITKLDFSSNRQVKQYEKLFTALSGGTQFGMPYSALTTGPDVTTTGITQTLTNLVSTFSGNSGTTIFSWFDSSMSLGEPYLSAITPTTSATTQEVDVVFTGASTGLTQDGYVYNTSYSGVSFDVVGLAMIDLGGGNYSGSVHTNLLTFYSADTIDYSGRTIWVDVSGITRTEDLIITNSPQVGYVFTCIDSEGKGGWVFNPSSSGATYWSATTLGPPTNGIVVINSNSVASGGLSVAEGYLTTASGPFSHAEGESTISNGKSSHSEGSYTTALSECHAEGAFTIASGTTSHAEGSGTTAIGIVSHAEGFQTIAFGNGSHAEGVGTTAYGDVSHAEGYNTTAIGIESHAEGGYTIASGDSSHSEGSYTTAIGEYSHAGGWLSVASGLTSFVHGNNSIAGGADTIVLGSNITGTSSNYTYVESLNIKTVGAGPSAIDIGVDANGNVVNNASDITLKENIKTIENALEKIKKLRGVYFNWIDRNSGGDDRKIGFIAQEVEKIVPELVYTHSDGLKVVHYKDVVALLIEAIKELASGDIKTQNTYLETQSVIAEDNNIDLNYGGNDRTAINGGIRVLHGLGIDNSAELLLDGNGNWVTNNNFIPLSLTIPFYTPKSSNDSIGTEGNITRDDDYVYIKTNRGWKRSSLESF